MNTKDAIECPLPACATQNLSYRLCVFLVQIEPTILCFQTMHCDLEENVPQSNVNIFQCVHQWQISTIKYTNKLRTLSKKQQKEKDNDDNT